MNYDPSVHARLVWLWEQGRPRTVEDEMNAAEPDTGCYCIVWPEDQGSSVHHPHPMLLLFYTADNGFDLCTLDDAPIDIKALPDGLLMDITEHAIHIYPEGQWN